MATKYRYEGPLVPMMLMVRADDSRLETVTSAWSLQFSNVVRDLRKNYYPIEGPIERWMLGPANASKFSLDKP